MCGRFQIDPDNDAVKELTKEQHRLPGLESLVLDTGEISPTDTVLVLAREGARTRPLPMSWGFPRWNAKGVVFNAQAETALKKPMFRKYLLSRPIVVPTTGFYEWTPVPGGKSKDKYIFHEPGEAILFLAGFAGSFPMNDGRIPDRFVILTTQANRSMLTYHSRMPVLLHRDEVEDWLSGDELGYFLERIPFKVEARRV